MKDITNNVTAGLGLLSPPKCHLYKLLLYEPGSFFKPHRDTEKEDRMFGTLVVQLPSKYEGGQLIVKHKNEKKIFDFSADPFNISYCAFYADCEHEVKPITSGYRICLVYNLIQPGPGPGPVVTTGSGLIKEATASLKKWKKDISMESPAKCVIVLDHKYTESSLAFNKLKNSDRAKADLLSEACRIAGCFIHLAILEVDEVGHVDEEDYDVAEEFDPGCIDSISRTLRGWITPHGKPDPLLSDIQVSPSEIIPTAQFTKGKEPDNYEVEETGNEGAIMERWYRNAAIVIWPEENDLRVKSRSFEPKVNLLILEKIVDKDSKTPDKELHLKCVTVANDMLKGDLKKKDAIKLGKLALQLREPELVKHILTKYKPFEGKKELDDIFLEGCKLFGLRHLSGVTDSVDTVGGLADLLLGLQKASHEAAESGATDPLDCRKYTQLIQKSITALQDRNSWKILPEELAKLIKFFDLYADKNLSKSFISACQDMDDEFLKHILAPAITLLNKEHHEGKHVLETLKNSLPQIQKQQPKMKQKRPSKKRKTQ